VWAELRAARRDLVTTSFFDDARGWTIIELTESVVSHAAELLRRHPLRDRDAVQLASGLAARAITGKDFGRFVAYDERLLTAARAEGLPIEEY
jgi:predicted nucleic acid-binding protein